MRRLPSGADVDAYASRLPRWRRWIYGLKELVNCSLNVRASAYLFALDRFDGRGRTHDRHSQVRDPASGLCTSGQLEDLVSRLLRWD